MRSIALVAAAAIAALLVTGCGSASHHAAPPAQTTSSSAPGSTSVTSVTATSVTAPGSTTTPAAVTTAGTTAPPSIAATTTAAPPTATTTATPSTTVAAAPTSTASAGVQLPIAAESDSQMKAEGNDGPSSSILLPTSCRQTGTTVTAEGTYSNNGFVPNVYNRYGDVIVLYVFAAPSPGYPQGVQLGASGVSASPVVGSSAPWHVSLALSPSAGTPARCAVAAQPTHAVQLAP